MYIIRLCTRCVIRDFNSSDIEIHTHSKVSSPSSTVSASTTALSDMANDEVPNFGTNARDVIPMLRLMGTFEGAKALTATADAKRAAAA